MPLTARRAPPLKPLQPLTGTTTLPPHCAPSNARIENYTYDQRNRLVRLTRATVANPSQLLSDSRYTYDERTRRTRTLENSLTRRLSFSGGTYVHEYPATANTLPELEMVRGSDLGGGGILYQETGSGQKVFNNYNSRGDVVGQTASTGGSVTFEARYKGYGTHTDTGTAVGRQRANSKDEDPSGLINEGMRYRDLEGAVFLTRDPAGLVDGPNVYTYVKQNPWTAWDTTGLATMDLGDDLSSTVDSLPTKPKAWEAPEPDAPESDDNADSAPEQKPGVPMQEQPDLSTEKGFDSAIQKSHNEIVGYIAKTEKTDLSLRAFWWEAGYAASKMGYKELAKKYWSEWRDALDAEYHAQVGEFVAQVLPDLVLALVPAGPEFVAADEIAGDAVRSAKAAKQPVPEIPIDGLCFIAGTEIDTQSGGRPIENLRIGDRVITTENDSLTEIDPLSWHKVTLKMLNPECPLDAINLELLRSEEWIASTNCQAGCSMWFELNEMGLRGWADVVDIEKCPDIQSGRGRVVLVTLTHYNTFVKELRLEGQSEPLCPTDRHRLFSLTRNDWVPTASLETGEILRTVDGSARIESIKSRPGAHRVFNIEVETEHSYFAGKAKVLSHNANPCAAPPPSGKSSIWTPNATRTPLENAFGYWKKHGAEFPEFENAKQYVEATKKFFSIPPPGTLTKMRPNGDTLFYNPTDNTFGIQSAGGAPRTMFRPTDGINYWNRQ